jgi:hypothetical protein
MFTEYFVCLTGLALTNSPVPTDPNDPWHTQQAQWSDFQTNWNCFSKETPYLPYGWYQDNGEFEISTPLFYGWVQSTAAAKALVGYGVIAWASGLVNFVLLESSMNRY